MDKMGKLVCRMGQELGKQVYRMEQELGKQVCRMEPELGIGDCGTPVCVLGMLGHGSFAPLLPVRPRHQMRTSKRSPMKQLIFKQFSFSILRFKMVDKTSNN